MQSGNFQIESEIRTYLTRNRECFIAIRGPQGVGKRHFLDTLSTGYEQTIRLESDIEQIQEFLSNSQFISSHPTLVLVPNIDLLSFVHQDALLRVLENPPDFHHIVSTFVSHHNIQGSVLSRLDETFAFSAWSDSQIRDWCAEMTLPPDAASLSGGLPGLLLRISQDPTFADVNRWIQNPKLFLNQAHKDPLSHMKTVEDKMYFLEFLKCHHPALSSDLQRRFRESMNINLDLHFQDVILQSLQVQDLI